MKILLYIYYFFRSVFLRGFFSTIKIIRYEQVGEKKYGIKTTGFKVSKIAENHHYQGASYFVLETILPKVLELLPNAHFVDIGCGMGRVCFVAKKFGFKNVSGFDLNNELIKHAIENLNTTSEIKFEVANALEYNYRVEETVYFLFNPFDDKILSSVLNKIQVITNKRTIIVYMNPIHKKCFEITAFREIQCIKTNRYLEAVIYSN